MKKTLAILITLAIFGFGAAAQGATNSTGNSELDAYLAQLNQAGSANSSTVLAQLANKFKVPVSTLDTLAKEGYKPGEIMFALELSKASGKSLGQVVALAKGKGHEWGLVAQSLGIKPGSKDFKELVGTAKDDAETIKTQTETKTEVQAESPDNADKQDVETEKSSGHGGKTEGSGHESGSSGAGEKD
ncbi:MAG TPA: hypothetical protein VMV44_16365 [Rectinemataceae bacterium]|nr:hypothetical protein [Rectinemataceae bacterium]